MLTLLVRLGVAVNLSFLMSYAGGGNDKGPEVLVSSINRKVHGAWVRGLERLEVSHYLTSSVALHMQIFVLEQNPDCIQI